MTKEQGAQIDTQTKAVLFGPIVEQLYPNYAKQKLFERFSGQNKDLAREQRMAMWSNYNDLLISIKSMPTQLNIVTHIYDFIKTLNDFARIQLELTPTGGLGIHLKEINAFCEHFFLDSNLESRFSKIISTHNAKLLTYVVAPLHDLLKFLGSTTAQIEADHEIITAQLVRTTFLNRLVRLGSHDYVLSADDVAFIEGVIVDHENINKEHNRTEFVHSPNIIERAKALFFIADVLTGVIEPCPDTNGFQINLKQLKIRFTDLYFRHIDLAKGKTFSPQWGVFTIKDILVALEELSNQGLRIELDSRGRTAKQIILDAALEAIATANHANQQRLESGQEPTFTYEQQKAISIALNELKAFQASY